MSKYSNLVQANTEHFNDYPVAHVLTTVVLGVVAVKTIRGLARYVGDSYAASRFISK